MNKIAFITGSTRGIGKAIALQFAKNNYDVILNGRKKTACSEKVLKEVKTYSPQSCIYYFDVSNRKSVEKNCQEIIKRYGKVDVLVNNAGILRDKTLNKMSSEEWNTVIQTNLYGPFYLSKQILPNMIKNNFGRIINIASIIGLIGNYGQSNYSASKAGLVGLTKSLAKEVAKFNITVNAVCPGLVETDILKDVPKKYLDKMIEKIALKRLAKPEELGRLILFIASEESNYITGSTINIDGGWS